MNILSGFTVAKQAMDLLKIIKEGRDESLIKKAAGDLSEKITELQMINAELSSLFQAERLITIDLKKENVKIEMFTVNCANYDLHTTEGSSTVYRSKTPADNVTQPHYLCTHCYSDHIISILQPSTEKFKYAGFCVHYCPRCKNEYRMGKVPPIPPIHVPTLERW